MIRIVTLALLLVASAGSARAQNAPVSFVPFESLAKELKGLPNSAATPDARRSEIRSILAENTQELVLFALGSAAYSSLVEENRIDKQVGTSAAGSGSTSLVSKGSVPRLIGAAVESGALYQSVSGSVVTLRVNPAGLAKAVARGSYLVSGPPVNASVLESAISRLSLSASFDFEQGSSPGTFTGQRDQLREASARYDILNRRDPRHPAHVQAIQNITKDMSGLLVAITAYFTQLKGRPQYAPWSDEMARLLATVDVQDDATLRAALIRVGNEFVGRFGSDPELKKLGQEVFNQITAFRETRDGVFAGIAKSPVLTVEYAYNRLTVPQEALIALPTGTVVPDLSTARVILSSGLGKVGEATVNGSASFFNSTIPQMRGNLRDVQLSGSVDLRLPEIQAVGRLVLTFAGMGVFLHQQPFGVPVTLEDVQTEDGTIGVFQTKLTIPAGASGMQIPLSFTWANRSEFNTEKEVRGAIGFTFDLDKLFSRSGN
jgi:hypothetical protein